MAPQERNSITCEDSANAANVSTSTTAPEASRDEESAMERLTDNAKDETKKPEENNKTFDESYQVGSKGIQNPAYEPDLTDKTEKYAAPYRRRSKSDDKKMDEKPSPEVHFDDLLPYLGEFGFYQRLLFLMMIPFTFFVSFVYFSQIFMTLTPDDYWCKIDELQNLTLEQRLSLLPVDGEHHAQCIQYDVDWKKVLENGIPTPDVNWPKKPCDNGWEYSKDVPYETITTELGWVCDKDGLPATAQAVFFCGAIVGGFLFGWLADTYGRIPSLVGTNIVGLVSGIATSFCSSFWSFCVCRFLFGMAFDNCFTMMYILVLEYTGPKWRTFVANMSIAIFFTLATCLLPWIAYFVADWRWFCVITSSPLILAIATPWFVPESARWLVSQGKMDEALVILKKFEKVNKTKIPEKTLHDFKETCMRIQKEEETSGKTYSVLDLFRTPHLRRVMILLIIIWMAISLVFDGHVRNVGSLGLDVFLTFTVAGATELPADTLLTLVLDKWGRRWFACGSLVMSGVFSIIATLVPFGIPSASLAIVGRFAINISYNIGLQYAAELLPTVVRAQGVALIHITGYIGSLVAPFIVYLVNIHPSLPLNILGILGILSGIVCLSLPETVDKDLPQTLQDGENFGRDQKFWDAPCCYRSTVEEDERPEVYRHRRQSTTSIMSDVSVTSSSFTRPALMGLPGSRASVRASVMQKRRAHHSDMETR